MRRTPAPPACEAVRVARRFVVATVPSKPDDNPEHIHPFDFDSLTKLSTDAGARSVRVEHVLNHIVALALLGCPRLRPSASTPERVTARASGPETRRRTSAIHS